MSIDSFDKLIFRCYLTFLNDDMEARASYPEIMFDAFVLKTDNGYRLNTDFPSKQTLWTHRYNLNSDHFLMIQFTCDTGAKIRPRFGIAESYTIPKEHIKEIKDEGKNYTVDFQCSARGVLNANDCEIHGKIIGCKIIGSRNSVALHRIYVDLDSAFVDEWFKNYQNFRKQISFSFFVSLVPCIGFTRESRTRNKKKNGCSPQ